MNWKKYIAQLVIVAMMISLIPEYVGAAFQDAKDTADEVKEEAPIKVTKDYDEIVNKRTENSKTFTNGKGNFIQEIYPEDIYNKKNDSFQEISENLVTKEKGFVTTEDTNLESAFPQKIKKDTPISYQYKGHKLEFTNFTATDGKKEYIANQSASSENDDNKITYQEIYPNIDLRHITLNNEVKEDWIVHQYSGIHQFNYTIQTELYGEVLSDGSIGFYEDESKDKLIFTLPAPTMMDSNINETKGEGVRSNNIHYELNKVKQNEYKLSLIADAAWLSSDKRVFPIYIDPSVTIDVLGDTYISSAYPKANFNKQWDPTQGEYVLQTGYYDSTSGTNYPYMKFSVAGDLKGATIDSAQLAAYVTHAYYVTDKTGLWVDEVNGQWYADDLTWNNKPSSKNIDSTTVARNQWAYFNVKNTIQAWVDGTRKNYGFKFHTNGHGKTYWKKITAAESSNKAKLVISYHYDQMPTPSMLASSYNDGTDTGYINVKWKTMYGASSYTLQMYNGSGYQTIYTGTGTSWSSKGKNIFPKKPYSTNSKYLTDGTGEELPLNPTAFYSAKSGTTITSKAYKFRVLAHFEKGDSPVSEVISQEIPAIPMPKVVAETYPESDTTHNDRGWLNISWNAVKNAIGYKVRIWNGTKYEEYTVGNVTSVSTKGKKIWPTDSEISNGITDLHQVKLDDPSSVADGAELPVDPSTTYGSSSNRYSVRIKAIFSTGVSDSSDVNYAYMKLAAPKNVKMTGVLTDPVNNKGKLKVDWSASKHAKYYEVAVNDGQGTKYYQVKGETTFTTPADFSANKTYKATVKAYFVGEDGAYESEEGKLSGKRGLSDASSEATGSIAMHEELIGLEDYFTYDEHTFGNAEASVNVTTGNMTLAFTDDSLYTRGVLGYDFTRYYNSRSMEDSPLGIGWSFMGFEHLNVLNNQDVEYSDEDGTKHLFTYNTDAQTYISPKGKYLTLEKVDDSTFTIKDKEGFIETYKVDLDENGDKTTRFHLTTYKDEYGNEIDFRYENGLLKEISEANAPDRDVISLAYDTNKRIHKVSYNSHWTLFTYDSNGFLVETKTGTDELTKEGNEIQPITEEFKYTSSNQLESYTDGKNNVTEFHYSEQGLKIFDKQDSDSTLSVSTVYQFDVENNQFIVEDSDDNQTVYNRDETNHSYAVSKVLNSDETSSTQQYDDQYNVIESIDEEGIDTRYEYDQNGNLKKETSTDGTITNDYNDRNQLTKSVDVTGVETTNQYEGPNLKSSTVGDETTSYDYDAYGRTIKTAYANGTFEETNYNDAENTATVTDAKGNTIITKYDAYGRKLSYTDGAGRKTEYQYDPLQLDVITSVTDGNGHKINYSYDTNGNLHTVTDALDRVKKYEYNLNDQVTRTTMPGMEFNYQYNSNGDVEKETLPSGITKGYQYNEVGDLSNVVVNSRDGEKVYSWEQGYTDSGQLQWIKLNDGEDPEKEFHYDENTGALSSYKLNQFTSHYQYDDHERTTGSDVTYQNGTESDVLSKEISYKEDADKLDVVKVNRGDTNLLYYKYDEDIPNNTTTLNVNNGLFKQIQQFNQANLLQSIQYKQNDEVAASFDYSYDQSGNIVEEETSVGSISHYVYDGNNQLTKETLPDGTTIDYQYDAVGNRLETKQGSKVDSFEYNDANQIKTKNGVNYTYDADGNLTQDEHYKYEYNALGQQTRVTDLDGKEIARYEYDETGLRIKKIIGEETHEYFYDNEVLVMEVIKNNNDVKQYRYYQWDDYTPLGMIVKEKDISGEWKDQVFHYWTNHRGDVVSIRDNEGKEIGSYQYDAYGNVLSVEGDIAKDNPIRYAGYYYDEETKNYYLQARYYNPVNGAFLALDPHPGDDDEPLSQNGYTYGNNNPLNNIDPNGNFAYATVGVTFYAIPGWGWAALGVVAVVTAGIWVAKYLSKRNYHFTIPKRLLRPDGTVNLGRFKVKVKGKTAYRDPETGWEIDKDKTGHGGRKWKLKNKKGERKASLDGKGKILSK